MEDMLRAEIIAIGDELSSGQRLDTNSQWISQQLGDLGIHTRFHTTVGDDLRDNIRALHLAQERADLVICTGGLGPTLDDLTRYALAEAFDCPLQLDPRSLEKIEQLFAQRQRPMPERNRVQAMFPEGCRIIENPHGSAPGIDLIVGQDQEVTRFIALPGVPAEMKEMWYETVLPRLEQQLAHVQGGLRYHTVKLFGIGESDVEVKLPTVTERDRYPTVGITVSRATITLRIVGRAKTNEDFAELIRPTLEEVREAMGDLVFGEGEEELQHVVVRLLQERHLRLATLEIGANSHLGPWLLEAGADSKNYCGNLCLPDWSATESWIGKVADANSDESLQEVVRCIAESTQADLAFAIGHYPNLSDMTGLQRSFPLAFAWYYEGKTQVIRRTLGGHPDVLGPRIGKTGLDYIRRLICSLPLDG